MENGVEKRTGSDVLAPACLRYRRGRLRPLKVRNLCTPSRVPPRRLARVRRDRDRMVASSRAAYAVDSRPPAVRQIQRVTSSDMARRGGPSGVQRTTATDCRWKSRHRERQHSGARRRVSADGGLLASTCQRGFTSTPPPREPRDRAHAKNASIGAGGW